MSEPYWSALGGGGAVDYKGAWAAGTQYQSGDVVRSNGVDYIAVNPSLGVDPGVATGLVVPGAVTLLDQITADVTIGETAVETTLGSKLISGGSIPAKGGIRATILGHGVANSPGQDKNATLRIKLGATTILPLAINAPGDFADVRVTQLTALILNQNTLNVQHVSCIGRCLNSVDQFGYAAGAVDTSVDQTLAFTWQWNNAIATKTQTIASILLEKIG